MEPDLPRRFGPEADLTVAWRTGGRVALLVCAVVLCFARDAAANDADPRHWLLQTGVYGRHYGSRPDLNEEYRYLGLEYHWVSRWLAGAATFRNSFDQSCQMLYGGKLWRPLEERAPLLHLKLVGGLVHGYKGEYDDNIPWNEYGVAPMILPTVGVSGRRFTSDVVFYYRAGFLVTVGVLF
jgi:hypothetical protein